jgi:hypothetical protein
MEDLDIIKDREKKYGPPGKFFETYGLMCDLLDDYASRNVGRKTNFGHMAALKMVLLKTLRSAWCPSLEDNYPDGRNYFTIAEKQIRIDPPGKE